ncbi:pyridoxamine 5'-phosphate oxidase [Sphingorhabdus sp. EL138]|uniref:pyridoxamine 5'-phosphate oxidase n=1 Tax=Sphingorhabdus sp. EL138 TaxID=2073156 RepID=UPI000D689BEF|nr:pyridoxamine 5'-phosphate oxidase [Sphingorhabdus sp. EL138]
MTSDPFSIFDTWYNEARETELNDSNAMTIATADANGQPAARMVLLKGYDRDGFIFYTNQESRKATDIAANPKAAILFHWKSVRRQIRIEGNLSTVSDEIADAYFATRSRDSQLGAWASDQSRPLDSRATFEARYEEMKARFDGQDVTRPPHWSGYRLVPKRFEFWQDREHRLHERRTFVRANDSDESWIEGMLYP